MAQATINATLPTNFILGGGQGSSFASLSLLPIAIIDAEPDPSNTINFGISASPLEAGLPATGAGGILTNDSVWLNYTYRATGSATAKIYVATNQAVPAAIKITVQVLASAKIGGVFTANQVVSEVILTNTQKVLVNSFASGYTGDGTLTGYNLRYKVENQSGISLPSGFEIVYEIK